MFDWESPHYRGKRRASAPTVKKKHWYRPRNTILIPLLVIVLIVLASGLYVEHELKGVQRAPFLADFGGPRSAGDNVLLVGSESPAHALALDQSTMIVQLVHLSANGGAAAVINLPRDLYLPEPPARSATRTGRVGTANGVTATGSRTLQEAYAKGGEPLLVETVQADLGVSIEHVAQIGFAGYVRVTDRLGGVTMPTPDGPRSFTGPQALSYVDATTGLANGDITNGSRNQQWLKAMIEGAFTPHVLLNPFQLIGLLHDTTPNLVLDDAFTVGELRRLGWKARHLRPDSIRYLTAPYRGFVQRKGATVLMPNLTELHQLGSAVRRDDASGIASFDN